MIYRGIGVACDARIGAHRCPTLRAGSRPRHTPFRRCRGDSAAVRARGVLRGTRSPKPPQV